MKDCEEIREWYEGFRGSREEARMLYAKKEIEALGYTVTEVPEQRALTFDYKGNTITLYPYKGWFTGKGVKDGRGVRKLLNQIIR